MEQCCETTCCVETENTENSSNDLLICEDEDCCEFGNAIESNTKNSAVLCSSQNKYLSNSSQLFQYNLINHLNKFSLPESSPKQYQVTPLVSVLRI